MWDFIGWVARGFIYYALLASLTVRILIWLFGRVVSDHSLRDDVRERFSRRRDALVRFASRQGLLWANFSIAENIKPAGLVLEVDMEGLEPRYTLTLIDRYDTKLRIEVDPDSIGRLLASHKKLTSEALRQQMLAVQRNAKERAEC